MSEYSDESAYGAAPPRTGVLELDDVIASVAALDRVAVDDQVTILESAHASLRRALDQPLDQPLDLHRDTR